jgi:GNAT superfamily N-acetyltransferase
MRIETSGDDETRSELTERLVEYNQAASEAVRRRFEPDNLPSTPIQRFAYDEQGTLVGGCTARSEDVWQWLTIDLLWVHESQRGTGLGRELLGSVEDEARGRGCRWSKVNTWDFQSPRFYEAMGYVTYGLEHDYPPGHTNHLMRKEL